jgi:hypothetical protein
LTYLGRGPLLTVIGVLSKIINITIATTHAHVRARTQGATKKMSAINKIAKVPEQPPNHQVWNSFFFTFDEPGIEFVDFYMFATSCLRIILLVGMFASPGVEFVNF